MRMQWRVYSHFLWSALAALAAAAWFANRSMSHFHREQVAGELLSGARMLAREMASWPPDTEPSAVDRFCKETGRMGPMRITVIASDGRVLGDSERDPSGMENHASRPEVAQALAGQEGRSVRFSDTIRRHLMYLAVPVRRDGFVVAVMRTSLPLAQVESALRTVTRQTLVGGCIVAALFAGAALGISRRISRPLERMREAAERLAGGDLGTRVVSPDGGEIGALANALNRMASQLGERMTTIERQSREQRAVFSSMTEGVLAVDGAERILHLNDAAARLLGVAADQARGRSIPEAVRDLDFQELVRGVLSSGGCAEKEMTLFGRDDRVLRVRGAPLTDVLGERLGALVVFDDVSRLKRLETMRRDFVANVSHELKTPITALAACVETLAGGALADPQDARRFVEMMGRHVARLGAIVEDLLSLSRIEHDEAGGAAAMESGRLADVLERSASSFRAAAAKKRIEIVVECPPALTARFNAALLEQAVGNLVDNAVKYGPDGSRVRVSAEAEGDAIVLRVADEGPGIEKKHLSRIFERFYRVDQARSRSLGGTGLGLAIVRHIALAHGGSVAVESTPGRGSVFSLRLPRQA
jgi:two-component system phosphate regulon sensor histidine kinase PhoR